MTAPGCPIGAGKAGPLRPERTGFSSTIRVSHASWRRTITGQDHAEAHIGLWAAALGITLGEEYHQDSRMTTITGTAKRERTRHGSATITLTGDIWED